MKDQVKELCFIGYCDKKADGYITCWDEQFKACKTHRDEWEAEEAEYQRRSNKVSFEGSDYQNEMYRHQLAETVEVVNSINYL